MQLSLTPSKNYHNFTNLETNILDLLQRTYRIEQDLPWCLDGTGTEKYGSGHDATPDEDLNHAINVYE